MKNEEKMRRQLARDATEKNLYGMYVVRCCSETSRAQCEAIGDCKKCFRAWLDLEVGE